MMTKAPILALAALAAGQIHAEGPALPRQKPVDQISDAYVKIFESVRTPLWVDLPDTMDAGYPKLVNPSAVRPLDAKPTRRGLHLLGLALGREAQLCDGAWVLHRSAALSSFETEDDAPILFNWLARLDSAKLQNLCGAGGTTFGELDQDGQDFVARLTRNYAGLQKSIADRSDVKVGLCYTIRVEVTDTRTGERGESFVLGEALDPIKGLDAKRVPDGELLGEPCQGALDFGNGRVAKLWEVLVEASNSLDVRFMLDRRFLSCSVFVKGRYTAKRLQEVLKVYTTAMPTDVIEESTDARTRRFEAARRRALELIASLGDSGTANKELKDQLLLGDQEMSGEKAAGLSPEIKAYLRAKGFGPEARVKLSRYLMVRICAAGDTGGVKNDVRFGFNQ